MHELCNEFSILLDKYKIHPAQLTPPFSTQSIPVIIMTLTTFSVVACLLTFSLASCCPSVSKHPILIVISFDGFRHDFQSKTYTPNLDYVASNGVSSGYLRPRFTTKTFPNHHSLATGMNPENHGVVDNFLWDSLYDEVLDGKDDTDHRFWNYDPSILPLWVGCQFGIF